jgi:hypothetical protein
MKLTFMIYHDKKVLDALPLRHSHTARTILVRRGKVSITDGPFAETKEQLGACGVASRFSSARVGIIEVHRVQELTHS